MTTSLASYRRNKTNNGNSSSSSSNCLATAKPLKNQHSRSSDFCISLSNHGEPSNDVQQQITHTHRNPDNQISDYGRMSSVGDDLSDLNEMIECEDSADEDEDEDEVEDEHNINNNHGRYHHRHSHNHLHNYNPNNTHINNSEEISNVEDNDGRENDGVNHIYDEDNDDYNNIEQIVNGNPEHNYMTSHSSTVRKEHNNRRSVVR